MADAMRTGPLPVVDLPDWNGPLPEVDPVADAYFRAAADGRLLVQECPVCGHRQHYPRLLCVRCAATPDWLECAGRGVVYSFTVVRQMGEAPFDAYVPYVVALIDLAEGPRMIGNVLDCDPAEVRIGSAVSAFVHRVSPTVGFPQWRLEG